MADPSQEPWVPYYAQHDHVQPPAQSRMWQWMTWDLLVTGLGHMLSGRPLTGILLLTMRAVAGCAALAVVDPDFPLWAALAGLLGFYLSTWISPLVLYLRLRRSVDRDGGGDGTWRYVFMTSCWTGLGNRRAFGWTAMFVQLCFTLATQCAGVWGRVPLVGVAALNTLFAVIVLIVGHRKLRPAGEKALPAAFLALFVVLGGSPPANVVAAFRTYWADYQGNYNELMHPVVANDEFVIVDRRRAPPERGQVVVVDYKRGWSHSFRFQDLYFYQLALMRIAAVSGDKVRIEKDGLTFVNDQPYMVQSESGPMQFRLEGVPSVDYWKVDKRGYPLPTELPAPPWIYVVPSGKVLCFGDRYAFTSNSVLSNMYDLDRIEGPVSRVILPPGRARPVRGRETGLAQNRDGQSPRVGHK